MASFGDCRTELNSLSVELQRILSFSAISEITVPEPEGMLDELFFRKLVAWSYVVLIEAFPIAIKQISSLMRTADRDQFRSFSATKELVSALRTLQSHNASEPSKHNEKIKSLSKTWIIEKAGDPPSWRDGCLALCEEMNNLISSLKNTFLNAIANVEDRETFIESLRSAYHLSWPAHSFDDAVTEAANELGLENFDVVSYREKRIENWRGLASFFTDRTAAVPAVKRAIFFELKGLFGDVKKITD